MSDCYIAIPALKSFMYESMCKAGVPSSDADIVADILIRADLRGIESHGIGRLKMYLDRIRDGVLQPVTRVDVIHDAPSAALLDGHDGMGHVVAFRAMKMAIEKAKQTGMAGISVRNSTHFGIAGYYALMAVQENMAGMAFTNARPSLAPTFGNVPMFGTNPIAFGVPTDEACPFMLDMATSIVQRGKVEIADRLGKPVPPGLAVDDKGQTVQDAPLLLKLFEQGKASLLPLGGLGEELAGYKGYGLAIMVEILSSAFSGGPFGWDLSGVDAEGHKIPHSLGHFFIAIDISKFVEIGQFKKITGDLLRSLRASGKMPGHDRIYTAGEKEFYNEASIPEKGVPINPALQKAMLAVKKDWNVTAPLPF
jgi:L-2-hydroxycarboxylate dehydrogenase (NAD+)